MFISVEFFGLARASAGLIFEQAVDLSSFPIALTCRHQLSDNARMAVIVAAPNSEDAAASPD